ncbi:hypothetical protein ADZ36_09375 [Streptomyces fradiae]|uniref:Uncharacterized protein n=1 Tax=Streptomyces fradiae TaxID=1906 RepID=A0ACC4WDH6_STRFR|nr:hypothetical protein ADZ36_09375 [Streptomyces fradiae]
MSQASSAPLRAILTQSARPSPSSSGRVTTPPVPVAICPRSVHRLPPVLNQALGTPSGSMAM